eukprot:scaffold22672_cov108-Isochrysis_galbana.AAC.1
MSDTPNAGMVTSTRGAVEAPSATPSRSPPELRAPPCATPSPASSVARTQPTSHVAGDRPGPPLPFYAELAGPAARTRRERAIEDLAHTVAQGGRIRLLCVCMLSQTMPRHVHSRAHARASPPTRRTPHRLGRQAIFPFCSAWAWDGGGGGGTIGGGGLPSPPYAHSKPY